MSTVSLPQMLLRTALAFVVGLIIGWERTSHGRAAGLRTTILACVAAAIAMVISEALFAESGAATAGGNWRPDPARLGAGILTGIGFLGAGTIIRHEDAIRGATTAATLWFVTVLGLAFGSGQFAVGFIGMAVAMAALFVFVLPLVEQGIQSDWYATLTVTGTLEALSETGLKIQIESLGLEIKAVKFSSDLEKKQRTLVYELKLKKSAVFQVSSKLVNHLVALPGVLQVKWD
jgi:putative Mg2+ transporter-C (MgtC) family protein